MPILPRQKFMDSTLPSYRSPHVVRAFRGASLLHSLWAIAHNYNLHAGLSGQASLPPPSTVTCILSSQFLVTVRCITVTFTRPSATTCSNLSTCRSLTFLCPFPFIYPFCFSARCILHRYLCTVSLSPVSLPRHKTRSLHDTFFISVRIGRSPPFAPPAFRPSSPVLLIVTVACLLCARPLRAGRGMWSPLFLPRLTLNLCTLFLNAWVCRRGLHTCAPFSALRFCANFSVPTVLTDYLDFTASYISLLLGTCIQCPSPATATARCAVPHLQL
jgi:hypothetical protein